jgi:hypothetical protein
MPGKRRDPRGSAAQVKDFFGFVFGGETNSLPAGTVHDKEGKEGGEGERGQATTIKG